MPRPPDVEIHCGNRVFKHHKSLLCAQSQYFEKAFREDTFKEGKEGVIIVDTKTDKDDDDAINCDLLCLMLNYFYTQTYECEMPFVSVTEYTGIEHLKDPISFLYYAIDDNFMRERKYKVRRLCEDVEKGTGLATFVDVSRAEHRTEQLELKQELLSEHHTKIIDAISQLARDLLLHVKMYALAGRFMVPELKELAKKRAVVLFRLPLSTDKSPEALRLLYETIPAEDRELRNAVVEELAAHLPDILDFPPLRKALQEIDGLAFDVLAHISKMREEDEWEGEVGGSCGLSSGA